MAPCGGGWLAAGMPHCHTYLLEVTLGPRLQLMNTHTATRGQQPASRQPATGENIAEVAGEGEDGVYRERETVGEGSYLKSINTLWAHGLST